MRPSVRDFVAVCAGSLRILEPLYEFGAFIVPGQEQLADLRSFFPGKKFVGTDMREGPGVDVVLDLHDIDLPDETAGTVLLLDTLEHVEYPRKALDEVHRILQPEGIVIMSSVMDFPIHAYPSDYWRYTPEAFRSLLKPFASCFVESLGRRDFPHTLVAVGFKGSVAAEELEAFQAAARQWARRWRRRIFVGWKEWVRRLAPPILIESYMQWRVRKDADAAEQ
jgi:SAM-dependent methyltransferase